MRRLRLLFSVVVVSVLAGTSLVAYRVNADNGGISLTTSPVVLSLDVRPGTTTTRNLQLMNNSGQPVKINMELDVFSAKGDNGDAIITAPEPGDPSTSWVSFFPTSFIAKPGVWSTVQMTISLPKTASLGYYYAALFKPDVPDLSAAGQTLIRGTNAILVLVDTHSGDEGRQLSIDSFGVSQGVYEYLPTTFHVSVRNSGNIYIAPSGNIFISQNSELTNTIGVLDVNPGGGNILPHTSRDFSADWSDGFPIFQDKKINGQTVYDNHGQPVKELSWSFAKLNKVRFGQYYAKVTLIYNDGKRIIPLSKVVSFWVIPWKLLLVTVAIIIVLAIGLMTIGRYFLRAISRKKVYRM